MQLPDVSLSLCLSVCPRVHIFYNHSDTFSYTATKFGEGILGVDHPLPKLQVESAGSSLITIIHQFPLRQPPFRYSSLPTTEDFFV